VSDVTKYRKISGVENPYAAMTGQFCKTAGKIGGGWFELGGKQEVATPPPPAKISKYLQYHRDRELAMRKSVSESQQGQQFSCLWGKPAVV
jgi:hypothetical protein